MTEQDLLDQLHATQTRDFAHVLATNAHLGDIS